MLYALIITFVAFSTSSAKIDGIPGKIPGGLATSTVKVGTYSTLESCQNATTFLGSQKRNGVFYGYATACVPTEAVPETTAPTTGSTTNPSSPPVPAYHPPAGFPGAGPTGEISKFPKF